MTISPPPQVTFCSGLWPGIIAAGPSESCYWTPVSAAATVNFLWLTTGLLHHFFTVQSPWQEHLIGEVQII